VDPSAAGLDSTIAIPNLQTIAGNNNLLQGTGRNFFSKVTVKSLFEGPYFDVTKKQATEKNFNVPAKGRLFIHYSNEQYNQAGVKALYYLTGVNNDVNRCWDPACGSNCVWSTSCEPLEYGHHGVVMPSGHLYFQFQSMFQHLPIITWKYLEYCQPNVEQRLTISIFDPDNFISSEYAIKEEEQIDNNERHPGVKLWAFEAQRLIPTCQKYSLVEGKDCDAETGFINVDFANSMVGYGKTKNLYISVPKTEGDAPAEMKSMIYSEVVSGFRLDYVKNWQMNAVIRGANAEWVESYKLFWVSCKPAGLAKELTERYSPYMQNYGFDLMVLMGVAMCFFAIFAAMFVYMSFWASSCLSFFKDITDNWPEINYI